MKKNNTQSIDWTGPIVKYSPIVLLILFFGLNVILLQYHETWMDEIQAWEILKSNDLFGMYSACKTEGHPMLWYVILKPFVALGFPIKTMNIISIAFMAVLVYLILKYVNIQFIWKVLIVFGAGTFYYNAVNARTYSLVVLAMTLVIITYKDKDEHPYKYSLSLLLLAQTHIIMCGFIAGFWLTWVYDLVKKNGFKIANYKNRKDINQIIALLIYSALIIWLLVQLAGIGALTTENEAIFGTFDIGSIVPIMLFLLITNILTIILNLIYLVMYQVTCYSESPYIVRSILEFLYLNEIVIYAALSVMLVFILVDLWNLNKKKLFTVILGSAAFVFIGLAITGVNILRLLTSVILIYLICVSEHTKEKHDADKSKSMYKLSSALLIIIILVMLVIYGAVLLHRETYCYFGMDTGQLSLVQQEIEDTDTLIMLDDTIDICDTINISFMRDKPFYNIYRKEYCTYSKYSGYLDEQYDADIPYNDILEFIESSNIDRDSIVLIVRDPSNEHLLDFIDRHFYETYSAQILYRYSVGAYQDCYLRVYRLK